MFYTTSIETQKSNWPPSHNHCPLIDHCLNSQTECRVASCNRIRQASAAKIAKTQTFYYTGQGWTCWRRDTHGTLLLNCKTTIPSSPPLLGHPTVISQTHFYWRARANKLWDANFGSVWKFNKWEPVKFNMRFGWICTIAFIYSFDNR